MMVRSSCIQSLMVLELLVLCHLISGYEVLFLVVVRAAHQGRRDAHRIPQILLLQLSFAALKAAASQKLST